MCQRFVRLTCNISLLVIPLLPASLFAEEPGELRPLGEDIATEQPAPDTGEAESSAVDPGAPASEAQNRVVLSSGMSTHQVRKRFGDPDTIETKKDSNLTVWHFGKSVIMFQRRRVSVWIDNGELGLRELVPKRAKREVSGDEIFRRRGWVNAWRRKSNSSQKQNVLDELLEED